tara:strand:- start:1522 stop:2223 length:702 start_codon:yes stop_codon:yes gene_type:complete
VIIPLFKTSYSIGKSLLRVEDIIDIAQSNKLKKVTLVEDNFYGFRAANSAFLHANIPMVYGIRMPVFQSESERSSKLVFFAKNNKGINNLRNLYSKCKLSPLEVLNISNVSSSELEDIKIGVPFYDSYIFKNIFNFGLCEVDLENYDHFYMEEDNSHPFDFQIKQKLRDLNLKTQKTQTIYYRNREDFQAFQMYKAVCSRRQGRIPTFSKPNLNDFCSDDFCFESFLEKNASL